MPRPRPKRGGIDEYRRWCLGRFSGVLCIDEVHEGSRHILFATDPLLDATIAWDVVKKCDQEAIDAFLDRIRAMGFSPEVVITDGSALYKESLVERWETVEHQLCIFHVLAKINEDVLRAARAFRDALPKPKRYRRGRPCRRGRPRKRDDRRKFVTEHLYLVVKRRDRFTAEDETDWRRMVGIDPRLETLKRFVDDVHGLFERGITKQAARRRRNRLARNAAYVEIPELKRAIHRLARGKFEKMIVFLAYENLDRTNNHVERGNRSFRMMQKTRYRRRRTRTLMLALELHVLRHWREHPLHAARARPAKRLKRRRLPARISRRRAA